MPKRKFTRCFRCNKRTKLYRCKHCGNYFCEEHASPKMPLTSEIVHREKDPVLSDLYQKEWREGGHGCVPYGEWKLNEILKKDKELRDKILKTLDGMKKSPIRKYYKPEKFEPIRVPWKEGKPVSKFEPIAHKKTETKHGKTERSKSKIILLVIILLIACYLAFTYFVFSTEQHFVKAYESAASFGRDPFTFCRTTCERDYNTSDYKVIEPNDTVSTTSCFCKIDIQFMDFLGAKTLGFFSSVLPSCDDGTLYGSCSVEKPYYCIQGVLKENASSCGCPYDFRAKGDVCEKIQRCTDGTIYGECSTKKPVYCSQGRLIERSSVCGCPIDEVPQSDSCISKFEVGPKEEEYEYILRGVSSSISYTVYRGLNDYLASLSRYFTCDPNCPSDEEMQLSFLDEVNQDKYLTGLVSMIESKSSVKDDQARIAISLVQKISYDLEGFTTSNLNNRYPYEVLYNKLGVCGEKARLLAFVLRELGYGVVLFNFETENHMAVGVKCPLQYSYMNTGYCFVETASPTIITNSKGEYVGVGQLSSTPDIYTVSSGISFDTVSEEYNDAQEWKRINELSKLSGGYLDNYNYYLWLSLVNKYDIKIS